MDKEPRANLWIAWMETLDGLGYITAGFSFRGALVRASVRTFHDN